MYKRLLTLVFLLLSIFSGVSPALENFDSAPISPVVMESRIKETITKIPEFVWIAQEAQKRGLAVWLFGGSASSLAHYVKDLILFERGLDDYYPEHFREDSRGNLDYTNIFLPTQDVDMVVDGSVDKVREFVDKVMNRYLRLRGSEQSFEIRPLRHDYGDKRALLENPDFLGQNTDSHSVGLVSLDTSALRGEVVKDLYHWNKEYPPFMEDVLLGQLRYYHGPQHKTTSRYRQGLNPDIISVIRYFIKLFQYRLAPVERDREVIERIIRETDWNRALSHGYVRSWLEKNVPKLFLSSRDVEYTANVLAQSGLKAKLTEMGGIQNEGTPAWWANKEPLRSFPLGQGEGRTAEEWGIKTAAHDTKNFLAWSSIMRSYKGLPNALISRNNTAGESTSSGGEGFYTYMNKDNGMYERFSIRSYVHPKAREKSDFVVSSSGLVIRNRNALRVIPNSITSSGLAGYFAFVQNEGRKKGNEGILEKFRHQMNGYHEEKEVREIIEMLKEKGESFLWREWFSLSISSEYAIFSSLLEYFEMLADESFTQYDKDLQRNFIQSLEGHLLKTDPQEAEKIFKILKENSKNILLWEVWFSLDISSEYVMPLNLQEYFQVLANEIQEKQRLYSTYNTDDLEHREYYIKLIHNDMNDWLEKQEKRRNALEDQWAAPDKDDVVNTVKMLRQKNHSTLWKEWFSLKISSRYPIVLEEVIKRNYIKSYEIESILALPHWQSHPRLLELLEGKKVTFDNLLSSLRNTFCSSL